MYRSSEEEQRQESWPSQPKVDFSYLESTHIPPRAKPQRYGGQANAFPRNSLEIKILGPRPEPVDFFWGWHNTFPRWFLHTKCHYMRRILESPEEL